MEEGKENRNIWSCVLRDFRWSRLALFFTFKGKEKNLGWEEGKDLQTAENCTTTWRRTETWLCHLGERRRLLWVSQLQLTSWVVRTSECDTVTVIHWWLVDVLLEDSLDSGLSKCCFCFYGPVTIGQVEFHGKLDSLVQYGKRKLHNWIELT